MPIRTVSTLIAFTAHYPMARAAPNNALLTDACLALRDFDYIDLGRIRMPSGTVPVTIKSLVFSQDPRVPHEHRHHHHHGDDQGHGHHHH